MKTKSPLPIRCQRPCGFTLIELLTVIAIIGILASILIPVVGRVRQSARGAQCASNLRQIGHAYLSYADEHAGRLPRNPELGSWANVRHLMTAQLGPYLDTRETSSRVGEPVGVWRCPEGPEDWHYTYAPNGKMWDTVPSMLPAPSRYSLHFDRGGNQHPQNSGGLTNNPGSPWHGGRMNVVFADAHVSALTLVEFEDIVHENEEPSEPGGRR